MQDLRRFLRDLTLVGCVTLLPTGMLRTIGQDKPSVVLREFRGTVPGQERVVSGISLCWCPSGQFTMGSPASERGHRLDEVQVEVCLSKGFWIGKFEVTQSQWKKTAGDFPDRLPSVQFGDGDDVPVYWVSFLEAEKFCDTLTHHAHEANALPASWEFRLPTEAQWEYACRASTTTSTSFGDAFDLRQVNYNGEWQKADRRAPKAGSARKVGIYPANAWGIHDMHGNVWEWCRDYYHHQLPGGTDPDLYTLMGSRNRDGTSSRVRRGGAWIEDGWACRSACRLPYEPLRRSDHIGFRVVAVEH